MLHAHCFEHQDDACSVLCIRSPYHAIRIVKKLIARLLVRVQDVSTTDQACTSSIQLRKCVRASISY